MPLNALQMPIYALTDVTGLVEWIDYIPAQVETAGRAGSTDDDGYLQSVNVLSDNTGLVAWVDYIPVYEVTGRSKPWYVGSDGYIPYEDVGAWLPSALFAAGEEGAWYDPSDLSTMFQESTGVTPVTAVEQSVGLILDKSKGLTLGSELAANGTFDSDVTGWTANPNSTIAWDSDDGGSALINITGSGGGLSDSQVFAATTGKLYKAEIRIKLGTYAGTFNWSIDSQNIVIAPTTSYQTFTRYLYVSAADFVFVVSRASAVTGTFYVSSISIKEVSGNHASQSTAANRPVLRARYNLLTYSEQFDNAAWSKNQYTVGTTNNVAPDGTSTADQLVESTSNASHNVSQSLSVTAGSPHTVSAYLKRGTRDWAMINLVNPTVLDYRCYFDLVNGVTGSAASGVTTSIESVGNGWYRCSASRVASAGQTTVNIQIGGATADGTYSYLGTLSDYMYVWGAQFENGTSTAGPYQRIAAATDYVTSSTMETYDFPYYLQFDGVDDYLATGTIDFGSGTDIAIVFGSTALGTAAGRIIDMTTTAPQFVINSDGSSNYQYTYNATANTNADWSLGRTDVVSALASSDVNNLRINQTDDEVATTSTAIGSGLIYVGQRSTGVARFNGRLHQLVIRGAATSGTDLTSLESYIAGKTGVTLP